MPRSLSVNSWHTFCYLLIFFQNFFFSKYSFRNTIRVSNSLDLVHGFVRPGPEVTKLSMKFQLLKKD